MTPSEKAEELVSKYLLATPIGFHIEDAKKCALIAVKEIILSNPHSNPFNTDVYSTMSYWQEVKTEIEKL
jgi:hypothetical protein